MSEEKTTVTTEKTETVAAPVTTDATQAKEPVEVTETTSVEIPKEN